MNTFTAEVSCIQNLTHDVREIELRLLEPAGITFKPGQFVSFEVPKEGQPRPLTRPYSIASPPGERERILLVLNLVQGGPGSSYLFGLRVGARTSFKGPAGAFYLRDDGGRDLLFVATGTGIAPIRSVNKIYEVFIDLFNIMYYAFTVLIVLSNIELNRIKKFGALVVAIR